MCEVESSLGYEIWLEHLTLTECLWTANPFLHRPSSICSSAPTAAPQDVQVVNISSTTLIVTWASPPLLQQHGVVVTYTVYYQRVPFQVNQNGSSFYCSSAPPVGPSGWCAIRAAAPTLHLSLVGLEPFINYSIKVKP